MPEKVRSPSFPFISLPEAVRRARLLYEAERRNLVSAEVAVSHWGYAPKSSGGRQTIAALKAFGLMEDVNGRLRLTDVGQHLVVREPGSPEHNVLLRQVALAPPVFQKLWDRYGTDLPPIQSLRSYLVIELKLNENAVEDLVRSFQETVAVMSREPKSVPYEDLTARFPFGEFRAERRMGSGEEEMVKAYFNAWLEQIREKPGGGS